MPRFLTGVSFALFMAGVGAIAVGLWNAAFGCPSFEFSSTRLDFGDVATGLPTVRTISVVNRSSAPMQIVGAAESCDSMGCEHVLGLPATVPAYGKGQIHIEFRPRGVGRFSKDLVLYVQTDRLSEQVLELVGRVGATDSRTNLK